MEESGIKVESRFGRGLGPVRVRFDFWGSACVFKDLHVLMVIYGSCGHLARPTIEKERMDPDTRSIAQRHDPPIPTCFLSVGIFQAVLDSPCFSACSKIDSSKSVGSGR